MMRRRWSCPRCGWTGTARLEVIQVFHPCRPRRRHRAVLADDARPAREESVRASSGEGER